MFYCQGSKKLSKPNESAHKLVTHVRRKNYVKKDDRKPDSEYVVGTGWEIAREILVCKEYLDAVTAQGFQPEVIR